MCLAQNVVPNVTKNETIQSHDRFSAHRKRPPHVQFFAYLILGRGEAPLEHCQPEEQHGFRSKRGIEEHLLTANMVSDKTLLRNTPLWIVSLDLSKAFDRVDWRSLWEALRLHGVSPHLIWLLQMTYANQKGQVLSNTDTSHEFDICAGVRQGCVLSPRLFCSVLQLAMGRWRSQLEHLGLNLGDGMSHLLDPRFAGDRLLFGESAQAVGSMLDALVACLEQVGLKLNASKTKVLTTQAQPPSTLTTPAGLELEVLEPTNSHKWIGWLPLINSQHGQSTTRNKLSFTKCISGISS